MHQLSRLIEALLFIGSSPVTLEKVQKCLPETTESQFDQAVYELQNSYRFQNRPYQLHRTPRGCVLQLTEQWITDVVSRSRSDRGAKLSKTVVDTLSVVAYRQPVTRASVEKLLGVDAGAALRQLIRRRIVEAREGVGQSEVVYVTTNRFLEMFELESIEDMPQTEDLAQL